MNLLRNTDRPMIFNGHPAIDALEDRIQTNVTGTQRDGWYFVEAAGFHLGIGLTVRTAIDDFLENNGL